MKRIVIKLLLVFFSALGVGVSSWLTYEHYLFLADPEHKAICDINETVSCAKVTMSPWSEVSVPGQDISMPISVPGVGFFAAALLLVAWGWMREESLGRKASGMVMTMMVPALGMNAALAWYSATVVQAWCIFCISLYISTLALFLLAWAERGGNPFQGIADGLQAWVRPGPGWSALALLLVLTASAQMAYSRQLLALQSDSIHKFLAEVDKGMEGKKPLAVDQGEHARGSSSAPFQLIEYADYQCPHCRLAYPEIEKIVERYSAHLQFIFRQYPLDQACNPFMQRPLHKSACLAARAGECADREGKFWPMHGLLFENPEVEYSPEMVAGFAGQLQLDRDAFQQCLGDESVGEGIRRQIETGKELGVNSTPTLVLNGLPLAGGNAPIQAELIIRHLLKKKGVALPQATSTAAGEVR